MAIKFDSKKLAEAREERKLNFTDLSFELYRSIGLRLARNTLENWESGSTCPDANELALMSTFYGKAITYFFTQNSK